MVAILAHPMYRKFNGSSQHMIRMQEECGNLSNSSPVDYQALPMVCIVFLTVASIVLAAIMAVNGLVATVLLRSTSVAIPIRVLLINLLVASILSAVISLCWLLNTVVLSLSHKSEGSLQFCRFILWGFSVTVEARTLGLVVFSTMVLQTVTCIVLEMLAQSGCLAA